MIKFKPFIVLGAILFVVTLMVPSILVLPFMEEKVSGKLGENIKSTQTENAEATQGPAVEVAVYRTKQQQLETLALEDYVIGVVSAEMPADFEEEALKAQALTARTYIVKQMMSEKKDDLPEGAIVTDTEFHQVFYNNRELKQLWGSDYNWKMEKIKKAVNETRGQILTYEGNPIDATFFSTSNGYTEDSDEIWPNALPYLTSVESPWDKDSPKYSGQKVITVSEFESKLGVTLTGSNTIGTITERTAGKRVGKVNISGKVISGKDIRDQLGLKSTDFTWERKGNEIVITTKGYGHGVGMSQYGANGMAAEGKNYEDIVKYYYTGIDVTQSDSMLAKFTAKK